MGLQVRVTLLSSAYEAARSDDPAAAEWPPSWMRVFCGLVSVAEGEDEWAALRAVELLEPPVVAASAAELPSGNQVRSAFVPTNAIPKTPTHQTYPGRTSGARLRTWARAFPSQLHFTFSWPLAELDDSHVEALARLARRIPYVGRSAGVAMVDLVTDIAPTAQGLEEYRPSNVESATVTLRAPHEGAVDALRAAYDQGERAWTVGRRVGYAPVSAPVGATAPPFVHESKYQDVVVFAFPTGLGLAGQHTARVTVALRRAVLSRADEHIATLHGHHGGSVPQCEFLALPDVGHSHADGHLLGVAVAIPKGLPIAERSIVLRGLLDGGGLTKLSIPPLGTINLRRITSERRALAKDSHSSVRGLSVERWSGPAERWATALPFVFDRFLKKGDDLADHVARACDNAHLPRPVGMDIDLRPYLAGGVHLRPHQTLRRPNDPRFLPYRHLRLRFARKVEGPVILGSMRHYGLGLCAPLGSDGAQE